MSRFSPTVRPTAPSSLLAALEGLYAGGEDAVRGRREQEERDRQRSIDDFVLRSQIEDDPRYTTERPEQTPRLPSIFEGQRPVEPQRPNRVMGGLGKQPGPAPASFAEMVRATAPPADEQGPRYLPGQFIREAGMFTERPVFEVPRLLRTDLVEQPEPVKPTATVAGIDVYRDPAYRTDEQKKQQTLASTLELLGRARGGDQRALDELLVQSPDLYETVSGAGKLTREDLVGALVPEGVIPAALKDPTLARQLVSNYNRPDEGDSVSYSREGLAAAGVPDRLIAAAVGDPTLARMLVSAYNKPTGGANASTTIQDLITRRSFIMSALDAVNAITRGPYGMNPDTPEYEGELRRVLGVYGYDDLGQLSTDVQALRAMKGLAVPSGGEEGGATGEEVQSRIDELLEQGLGDDEIERVLREEGLISQ